MNEVAITFRRWTLSSVLLALALCCGSSTAADTWCAVKGSTGYSLQWQSGWLDLPPPHHNFAHGERLRLNVGGTATSIIVRLLSENMDPNDPSGIDGSVIKVPSNRVVEISLQQDHELVRQISVHGGENPWGLYPLGSKNGAATLSSVERECH